MAKAIIIGATSGIGQAIAQQLAQKGYHLGLTGRRLERLEQLKTNLPGTIHIQLMDVTKENTSEQLKTLINALGGLDLLIINAGISHRNGNWEQEKEMIATNISGFTACASIGFDFFRKQGYGHIAGMSSISAIRGRANNLCYSASKAYVSNYLQGLRQKAFKMKKNIALTEIIAGYVDTRLIHGHSGTFWIAPVEKAARQIIAALQKRKSRVYITRRWRLLAWFLTFIPDWLHKRL